MEIIFQAIKWLLVVYAVYSVTTSVFTETSWSFTKNVAKNFTFLMFVKVVIGIAITISTFILLYDNIPFLQWSWTQAIFGESINIISAPIATENKLVTYLIGIPFLLLLLVAIPRFAYSEEKKFRRLTVNHKKIFVKSLVFGMVHCIVGIPLAAGLALSIGGLVFGYAYRTKFLSLLKDHKFANDFAYMIALTDDDINSENKMIRTIHQCNEEALMYSTSYHTMWNWILITTTLVTLIA